MERASHLMNKALSEGVFPGAVLLASTGGRVVLFDTYGVARIKPEKPLTKETVFDLASLTKPLATTLGIMILAQTNRLFPDQEISTIIPAFGGTNKERVTIRQLLAHSSGLPAYRPYYKVLMQLPGKSRRKRLQEMLLAEPLIARPGDRRVYSDIGFMILEWVLAVLTTIPLNIFVEKIIYNVLNLEGLFFLPLHAKTRRHARDFAATEDCAWRKKLIEGEVHDDNAYALGGVAGHAGLFGTAVDVHRLLSELLNTYHAKAESGLFQTKTVRAFFEHIPLGGALGFDTPTQPGSSSGRYFSESAVGHLGYTGTSFWIDLERSIILILLTNRVHPTRENNKIKAFRPVIHDAIMKELLTSSR